MITRLLASITVFVAVSVVAALLLVLPGHHGLDAHRAFLALGAGLLATVLLLVQQSLLDARSNPSSRLQPLRRSSPWTWIMFTAFALFGLRAYCWLVFNDANEVRVGSPNNLGDLSLHLLLTHYFANGVPWWPDHPQHAWTSLRYYPGVDLFQSLLLLAGADESRSLVWVGLLGTFALAAALYKWGGGFTMAGFLFNGGLAGFAVLRAGVFKDYQDPLAWKSLPLAIFITQRPFLYALPAGLLLLAHWRRKFFAREAPLLLTRQPGIDAEKPSRGLIPFWVEALLYTTMPLLHLFTFFFLSLLLGWWLVVYFQRAALRRHLLWLIGVALVPATWQVHLMTGGFGGGGMTHLSWGWMREGDQSFVWFWLLNFGLFLPLAVACWLRCVWKAVAAILIAEETDWIALPPRAAHDNGGEMAAEAFVIPAGIIFMFASVVMFTAWNWDNAKILLWCYLATLPFLWERWIAPLRLAVRWPLCAALFFSGFVCLIGGLKGDKGRGYELIGRKELDAVRFAVRELPAGDRFAAAPDYNHPLVFCGRKLAMGYPGHLFSQGLDYRGLEADLRALMTGKPEWGQCAGRLGVRYLYWGARERAEFPGSARPWETRCQRVANGDWGSIYDLRQSPAVP